MNKLRHTERRETLAYWPAREEQSGEEVGVVTDLSEEGINIHSRSQVDHGQKFNIRVAVDPKLTGLFYLHLHVENVWCKRSGAGDSFHSGFKILNLSAEARDGIRKLLSTFSYPAPHVAG